MHASILLKRSKMHGDRDRRCSVRGARQSITTSTPANLRSLTHALVRTKHLQASLKCTSAKCKGHRLPQSQAQRLCSVSFAGLPTLPEREQQIWFPLRHRALLENTAYLIPEQLVNRSYKPTTSLLHARLECARGRRLVAVNVAVITKSHCRCGDCHALVEIQVGFQ